MGIAYVYSDSVIKYNFIDLDYATWSFASFQDLAYSLSYGDILDMDIRGYWKEDRSIMVFGWLSRTSSASYVCSVLCQDDGVETPSDGVSPVVENQNINVTVSSSTFIVNGYRKIGLSLNSQNLPALVTMGASSGIFTLSGGS